MNDKKGVLYKYYLATTRRKYADVSKEQMIENELDIVPSLCSKAYKKEKLSYNSNKIGYGLTLGLGAFLLGAINPAKIGYTIDLNHLLEESFPNADFSEIGLGVHNALLYAGFVGALAFSLYGSCKQMQSNKLQLQNQCFTDLLAEKQNLQNENNQKQNANTQDKTEDIQKQNENNQQNSNGDILVNKFKKHYYNKEMQKLRQEFQNYTEEEMAELAEKFIDDNLRKVYSNNKSIEKSSRRSLVSLAMAVGYNLGTAEGSNYFYELLYSPDGVEKVGNLLAGAMTVGVFEPFKITGLCAGVSAKKSRSKAKAYEDVMQEKTA